MHIERRLRNGPERARAGDTHLIEREGELQRFDDMLSALGSSRGRVVMVEGPLGIGRTSLLHELRDRAEDAGVLVLSARIGDLERDVAGVVIRQLIEHVPELAETLAVPHGVALPVTGAELAPEQEMIRSLHSRLMEISSGRPLLITVDDVQAADPHSLRFLVHLATRVEWSPIALALSRRTGEPPAAGLLLEELVSDSQVEELRPRPLSPLAVQMLTEQVLEHPPHPSFTAEILRTTGGNPLFAGELLRELRAAGVAPDRRGAAMILGTAPRAVARSVLLHVGRLGEAAVAYAQAAAVLGDGCEHKAVQGLANLDEDAADAALDLLAAADVLEDAGGIHFRHRVACAALYREIPARELTAAHGRAVEVLREHGADADTVAHHLLYTRPRGDPVTADALVAAGRRALDRGAPARSAQHLRRALEEPVSEAQRREVAHDLADALLRLGDPDAIRRVDQALDALDAPRRLWLMRRAANLVALRGQRTATLDELLRESSAHRVLEAMLEERPAEELGELAVTAMAKLDLHDLASLESPAIGICVNAAIAGDRDGDIAALLDLAADQALMFGSTTASAVVFGARARAGLASGRLAEADADAAIAMEAAKASGLALLLPLLAALQAVVQLEREGPETAWRTVRDLRLDDLEHETPFASRIHEARAAVHLAAGRPREALADLEGAAASPAPLSRWRALAAIACLALGDRSTAAAHAERELEAARAFGAPRRLGAALRVQARTVAPDEAEALLREAVCVLSGSHDRLELAGALVDLGARLRRENRRLEARPELLRGHTLALQSGALQLAERASAELAATGARARTGDPAAVDRLTSSERRVAALAARGRSNPQIAAELVITRKTVELHLTNVYRKLGIGSRSDLAQALEPVQDHP